MWAEEVERFAVSSPARTVVQREREGLERIGVRTSLLLRCDAAGRDGTQLGGLVKVYVPIREGAPSSRPFGLVLAPSVDRDGHVLLEMLAFGERHPRRGTRSVYERAHKRRHGRYPDQ